MSEDLDKERRHLVPVARLDLTGQPDVVHLAVYEWLSMFDEWATGPALCGYSTQQGPLPDGTVATCRACLEWKPRYERMLVPGYRPEDDDPEVLRRCLAEAEAAIERVRAVIVEHRAQVDEHEHDGLLPMGDPRALWCDSVKNFCSDLEQALARRKPAEGIPLNEREAGR